MGSEPRDDTGLVVADAWSRNWESRLLPLGPWSCLSCEAYVCMLPDLPQSQQLWLKVCLG
jgi:hypothetical protein